MARVRLDSLLVERGLYESRSRAAAAVVAGDVLVGKGHRRATKPSQLVAADEEIAVTAQPPFVSRGGIKLANALDSLQIDPMGRSCLDVGASTGGFTDCLLQRGAERVVAFDVAYGELHWKLRQDPRVTVIERSNAREITRDVLPFAPGLIVIDVSFISLRKLLERVLAVADSKFDCLALVKPQFEVGRGLVGKGGVVRDAVLRQSAITDVARFVHDLGHTVRGFASSGLPGPAGNKETFIWIAEPGRPDGIDDFKAAAQAIDPDN